MAFEGYFSNLKKINRSGLPVDTKQLLRQGFSEVLENQSSIPEIAFMEYVQKKMRKNS
ncbi:hypothetical protein [Salinimicrobium soli]|uniref:hypothetical protein n=1 Tax=Salinimicrobium soli TaxID=1254399 RepID=UPI003AB0622D